MACTLKLPVGIDSFEKIRRNKFYYIDKTKLIEQLVETGGEVTLFTRPRRFGKTLNMRMLKAFFGTGADESLFDGLYIAQNKALCEEHMGKYPVIFLSLKSVEGLKYEDARYRITELIGIEAERFGFLEDSEYLSENEKKRYKAIIALKDGTNAMDEKLIIQYDNLVSRYKEIVADKFSPQDFIEYNEILFSAHSCAIEGNSFSVDETRTLKERGLGMIPQNIW